MEEKKTNKLPIILIIIGAVCLTIGGFYLGKNMNKQDKCLEQENHEVKKEESNDEYERGNFKLKKSDLPKISHFLVASTLLDNHINLEDKLDNKNIFENENIKTYFAFIYGHDVFGDYYIPELDYDNEMKQFTTAQGAASIRFEDYKAIYEAIYGTKYTKNSIDENIGQVVESIYDPGTATILCSSYPTGLTGPLTFEFEESDFKDGEGVTDIKSIVEDYEFDGKIKVTYVDLGNDVVNITGIYLYK